MSFWCTIIVIIVSIAVLKYTLGIVRCLVNLMSWSSIFCILVDMSSTPRRSPRATALKHVSQVVVHCIYKHTSAVYAGKSITSFDNSPPPGVVFPCACGLFCASARASWASDIDYFKVFRIASIKPWSHSSMIP